MIAITQINTGNPSYTILYNTIMYKGKYTIKSGKLGDGMIGFRIDGFDIETDSFKVVHSGWDNTGPVIVQILYDDLISVLPNNTLIGII